MTRKSNISDRELQEIELRHLKGETLVSLADEFGVSLSLLNRRKIGEKVAEVKRVARELVEAEKRFESLPIGMQIEARTLANELKAISMHLASAAKFGAMTASRMAQVAHEKTELIDPAGDFEDNGETMRSIAAFTELANKSSVIGMNLLNANKKTVEEANNPANVYDITPKLVPDDPVEASRAYQRMIGSV